MEIVNQMGHLQHWGISPAADLSAFETAQPAPTPYRILLSGCSDIRHILKTLCDAGQRETSSGKRQFTAIEFYIHETNKELLCRSLLFLHIIHETHLSFEERIEIFLDLYGNAMIKERNARYLHALREDLLNLIHGEKNVATVLKRLVNLKLLRFEERDELSQIIQSWSMKIPLEMNKLRDQKLRSLFKERYDFRSNLIDWDYNMLLLDPAPIVHYYHYKQWRLSGLAYEQRFSKYSEPNRTLASYAPGRKKDERTSCLVRGYWGDIVTSPYIALGIRCNYAQADLLFKKANYKYIGHSVELANYNMIYWLTELEKQKTYVRHFRDYYRADEATKQQLEKKNVEKKKAKDAIKQANEEEEEDKHEDKVQQKTEQVEQKEEKQEEIKQTKPKTDKKKAKREEVLDSDEEEQKRKVEVINSKEIEYAPSQKELLPGFSRFNSSVHLMAMGNEKLLQGSKWSGYFDMVVLGFVHSAYLTKKVENIVKPGGLLLTQKATYLIPKKKEQRKQLNDKLRLLAAQIESLTALPDNQDFLVNRRK